MMRNFGGVSQESWGALLVVLWMGVQSLMLGICGSDSAWISPFLPCTLYLILIQDPQQTASRQVTECPSTAYRPDTGHSTQARPDALKMTMTCHARASCALRVPPQAWN